MKDYNIYTPEGLVRSLDLTNHLTMLDKLRIQRESEGNDKINRERINDDYLWFSHNLYIKHGSNVHVQRLGLAVEDTTSHISSEKKPDHINYVRWLKQKERFNNSVQESETPDVHLVIKYAIHRILKSNF
jgi:hypothetical protein